MEYPGIVSPDQVEVDASRLTNALDILRDGVADSVFPGFSLCALRDGHVFVQEAFGTLDGNTPTEFDSLYDLASLTKPMATASSLLTLVERGRLNLTDSVATYLGDDAERHLKDVTIWNLLTHTSGLPSWIPCYKNGLGLDAAVDAICNTEVTAPPGTKYEYSCLGFILLGKIIEEVSGYPLDICARRNIFEPLNLSSATYVPHEEFHARVAPTRGGEGPEGADMANPVQLRGTVHDGNARGIGGISGNAGLFGTAQDVALFGEAMRRGSRSSIFGAPTSRRILESQISPTVGGHTLMFFANPNGLNPRGDLLSDKSVGHSGYTGTVLTIDPEQRLVIALLTNRVYLDLEGKRSLALRRRFLNALAASIL